MPGKRKSSSPSESTASPGASSHSSINRSENAHDIRRIHLLGFVNEVRHIHENMPDRRFCFVLGAGASKPSEIPTAGELGLDWLKQLHAELVGTDGDFAKWLSEGGHGIDGLPQNTSITDISVIAAAYPAIYHAKWGHDRAQGHAEIERHIEAAKPSYGYYALAEILASDDAAKPSRHNVVITPNFDNLPAEALGALGKKIPIVIGHSAITDFARPTLRRPLIIKFHHDFLLSPKSDPKDVGDMEDGYSRALAEIFRLYTPIVVGYGGNDGSLMGLLENLPEKSIPGGILWCWRTGDPPSERINTVVSKQAGTLIEISGFDELMALLEAPFGHVFNPKKLSERANDRADELSNAKERLTKKAESSLSPAAAMSALGERRPPSSATAAASAESSALLDALSLLTASPETTVAKKKDRLPWWHWQHRINATQDLDEKERLFEEAIKATQQAHQLLSNYAIFLSDQRKDYMRAEKYYLEAIAANPNKANNLGNYAIFLSDQLKDYRRAEEYYLKAIAADPNNANNLGNYANFLIVQLKDDTQAEEYYLKAIAADPNNVKNLGNYAVFLKNQHKDDARAEEYYLKAIAVDPNNINTLGNYAQFLICCGRFREAEPFSKRAWAQFTEWNNMGVAEVLFSRWLLTVIDGNDGQAALGRLKSLLQAGYTRLPWSFDRMLAACVPKLNHKDGALARSLAAAILDESKTPELNSNPVWSRIRPIPVNAPWPDNLESEI